MTTTKDAATIAASIDLATHAAWDLRALLLRLLDGSMPAMDLPPQHALRSNLVSVYAAVAKLTPLGREVAERLRPVPWRVGPLGKDWAVYRGGNDWPHVVAFGALSSSRGGHETCNRIAALLTADDLRAAKTYRTEPDQ
jgi:hypothetical protein